MASSMPLCRELLCTLMKHLRKCNLQKSPCELGISNLYVIQVSVTDFVVPCCHPYLCVFYKHCTNAHANIPLWMFGNLAVWLVESGGFEDVNRACGTFGEIDQSRCLFHSETRLEYDQRLGATNHYICVLWRTSTTVH